MANYKEVFVAHFETAPRRRGRDTWGTKEFDTKWEAEKYMHEYQKSHWYASDSGWVDSKVIDLRSDADKAYAEKVHADVSRYCEKMWKTFHF